MTPAISFDPYILQQASCRASLLVATAGIPRDDWQDLRQDLVLDCLQRSPRFDPARGDWRAFVRGVIRNHSTVLANREIRRAAHEGEVPVEEERGDEGEPDENPDPIEPGSDDPIAALNLSVDVERVLAGLPDDLRTLARQLMEMSIGEIAERRGKSRQWIHVLIGRLRRAFERDGVTPETLAGHGGAR